MKRSILTLIVSLASLQLFAQYSGPVAEPELAPVFIGPGLGLDYGGIGINVMAMPSPYVGLFVGAGYNFVKLGFNGGARIYLTRPSARARPYFSGMYGYYAAIHVADAEQYDKVFYGATFGFGVDIMNRRNERNYWTLALHVPLRGTEVDDYMASLKPQGIEFKGNLLPVTFTVGFRIGLPRDM